MKIAITDERIPKSALKELERHCDKTVLLPPLSALAAPISSHTDMLILPIHREKLIYTHPGYFKTVKNLLGFAGYEIKTIDESLSAEYPHDILLNAAVIGNHIFGKLDSISAAVLKLADKGFTLHSVKQGYTKCSVVQVSDNAIITADKAIGKEAEKCGLSVLYVAEGHVTLPGYSFGFIGGASGYDGENIFFCGDISAHSCGEKISEFCDAHGKKVISLSNKPLFDVGSIFFINT